MSVVARLSFPIGKILEALYSWTLTLEEHLAFLSARLPS